MSRFRLSARSAVLQEEKECFDVLNHAFNNCSLHLKLGSVFVSYIPRMQWAYFGYNNGSSRGGDEQINKRWIGWKALYVCREKVFLAATKQLYEWFSPSVRLSVRLSVRPSVCLSHLFDYVPIILSSWNFQELLPVTKVTSMQKVKVKGQGHRGHNPT